MDDWRKAEVRHLERYRKLKAEHQESKQQIETLLDRNLQLSNDVDQLKVRLLIESRYMAVNRRTGGVWRSASLPDVAVAGLERSTRPTGDQDGRHGR